MSVGDDIALTPGVVDCDAARFEALIRDGGQASFDDAVALYEGRLLPDLAIEEEAWIDWVGAERQRLESAAISALVRLGEIEAAQGQPDKAVALAQRALSIDNLREDAHRLFMRALAGAGRSAEALKHYRNLVDLLKRELSTDPDAATKALAVWIKNGPASVQTAADTVAKTSPTQHASSQNRSATEPPLGVPGPVASIQGGKTAPAPMDLAGGAERRQLTVMVCSLTSGSQQSSSDPEEVRDQLAAFHARVAERVTRFDGFVAHSIGDSVHVYFGYPAAREDDAEQAVRAALAIRETFGTGCAAAKPAWSASVGIATGLVVVEGHYGSAGRRQKIAIGLTPNTAMALHAKARPGEVIIAKDTWQLVGRLFDCRSMDSDEAMSSRSPIEAWLVSGVREGVSRFDARRSGSLSPLVGRQEEIELLLRRWAQVKAGNGRVVLISGEAGIGKSRITQEFKRRIEVDDHLWIECGCAEYLANTPFQAIAQTLDRDLRMPEGHTASDRYAMLERALAPTDMKLDEVVPLIAELIGLPPSEKFPPLIFAAEQRRTRLLAALAQWVFSAAKRQPVVLLVEDLHWVDPSSLELLQTLADQSVRMPLLLLSTARPELPDPWPMQAHHSHFTLNRLNANEARKLVAGMSLDANATPGVVEAVIERADGVPLFVEELARLMLHGSRGPQDIPVTLLHSLTARLDRTGAAKRVAQLGALLGREFAYDVLAAVSRMPGDELVAALVQLSSADLVYARGKAPHSRYQFKHALVQDAAYQSLLKSQRRELHATVARTIEADFPEIANAQPQMLARHWSETDEADKAFAAWLKAGKSARARHAFVEAGEAFRRARNVLYTLPESRERDEREQELLALFGAVLNWLVGSKSAEMIEVIARNYELAEKHGDLLRVIGLRFTIYVHSFIGANWGQASTLADQLTDFVEHTRQSASTDVVTTGVRVSNYAQFITNFYRGNVAIADTYFKTWQASPSSGSEERNRISPAWAQGAVCAWHLGKPVLAAARLAEAMSHAEMTHDPWDLAYAHMQDALMNVHEGDPQLAESAATRAIEISKEKSFVQIEGLALPCLGWARARLGHPTDGLALISRGIALLSTVGSRIALPMFVTMRGEAEAVAGLHDAAFATFDEALRLNPDEQLYRTHTLISRGRLHAMHGQRRAAKEDFESARVLARKSGALACERRASDELTQILTAGPAT